MPENPFGFPIETLLIFLFAVSLSLYLDLFAHRKHQSISLKNAALWSFFWVSLALFFYLYLGLRFNWHWANLYLTGYLLEKSLSVDNLMIFVAIFHSFGIRQALQHHILYWGIIGALIFRAVFVIIGAGLFASTPWVGFLFAAFVLWSAFEMLGALNKKCEDIEDYSNHYSVRWIKRFCAIYPKLFGFRFFIKNKEVLVENRPLLTRSARLYATPAFLCLVIIESSDLAFAFDSAPAVIAITQEPLLIYTATIFAVLGLRSLYFVLTALKKYIRHLDQAVVALVFFIGFEMLFEAFNQTFLNSNLHLPNHLNLIIILGTLSIGTLSSFLFPPKK